MHELQAGQPMAFLCIQRSEEGASVWEKNFMGTPDVTPSYWGAFRGFIFGGLFGNVKKRKLKKK